MPVGEFRPQLLSSPRDPVLDGAQGLLYTERRYRRASVDPNCRCQRSLVSWVDIAVVTICGTLCFIESKRGFFPAVLDFAGIVAVTLIAKHTSGNLSGASSMQPPVAFAVLYLVLTAIVITGAKFIAGATQFEIGPFDAPVGGVMGICTGVAVSYALVEFLNLQAGGQADAVAASFLAPQVHEFRAYHNILQWLHSLGESGKTNIESALSTRTG